MNIFELFLSEFLHPAAADRLFTRHASTCIQRIEISKWETNLIQMSNFITKKFQNTLKYSASSDEGRSFHSFIRKGSSYLPATRLWHFVLLLTGSAAVQIVLVLTTIIVFNSTRPFLRTYLQNSKCIFTAGRAKINWHWIPYLSKTTESDSFDASHPRSRWRGRHFVGDVITSSAVIQQAAVVVRWRTVTIDFTTGRRRHRCFVYKQKTSDCGRDSWLVKSANL